MTEQNDISQDAQSDPGQNTDNLVGAVLDEKYLIISVIGKGAYGTVYRAQHKLLDKLVAVKVLNQEMLQSESSRQRFRNEAQLLSTFEHDNIVQFQNFGTLDDGRFFMVLEYLHGKTLAQLIRDAGPLSTEQALEIFIQVASGLSYAHSKNVIHRDLKPDNLMIVTDSKDEVEGEKIKAKILDFGIFKFASSEAQTLTKTGATIGTVNYMSPEQCKSQEADARSDIYSLACVMYEALVAKPPMQDSNDLLTMANHANKKLTSIPSKYGIPKQLEKLILKCLEKEPSHRIQSADALITELQSCIGKTCKTKSPMPVALAVLVLLGLAFLIATFVWHNKQNQTIKTAQAQTQAFISRPISSKESLEEAEKAIQENLNSNKAISNEMIEQFYHCSRYRRFHQLELKTPLADALVSKLQSTYAGRNKYSELQYKERMTALAHAIVVLAVTDQEEKTTADILELAKPTPFTAIRDMLYVYTAFRVIEYETALGQGQKARNLYSVFFKHGDHSDHLFNCFCIFWDPELTSVNRKEQEAKLDIGVNEIKLYLQEHGDMDDSILFRLCEQLSKLHYPRQACDLVKLKYSNFEVSTGKFDFQIGEIKRSLLQAYYEMKYMDGAERLAKSLRDQYLETYPQSTKSDDAEAFYLVALRGGQDSIETTKHEALKYVNRVKTCDKARLVSSLESIIDNLGKLEIEKPKSIYEFIDHNASEFADKDPDLSLRLRLLYLYKLKCPDSSTQIKRAHELLDALKTKSYSPETITWVGSITAITFANNDDLGAANDALKSAQSGQQQATPEANFIYEYARGLRLQKKNNGTDLRKCALCWENILQQWNGRSISNLPYYYLCADGLAYEYERLNNLDAAMATLGVAQSYLKEYRKSYLSERLQILEHLSKLGEQNKHPSTDDWKDRVFEINKVLKKRTDSGFKSGLKDFF